MKNCPKCKIEKDESEFSKAKNRKDGLNGWCKPCQRVSRFKWSAENKDRIKEVNQKWIENNKERHKENGKRWSSENKERHRFLIKQWTINNPDKVKAKHKRHTDKLPDHYIKSLLIRKSGFPKEAVEQIPILIELRRASLKTKRELKKQLP